MLILSVEEVAMSEAIYDIIVDYNLSLAKMIAAGKYDVIPHDIKEVSIPIQESGIQAVTIEFVRFWYTDDRRVMMHYLQYREDMTTEEVLKDMESKQMRPATLPELLAFGAKFRKVQQYFSIVALGTIIGCNRGTRRAPVLGGYSWEKGARLFGLELADFRWGRTGLFAAVRK